MVRAFVIDPFREAIVPPRQERTMSQIERFFMDVEQNGELRGQLEAASSTEDMVAIGEAHGYSFSASDLNGAVATDLDSVSLSAPAGGGFGCTCCYACCV
jgi:predicted ribosomally synthesized peptide with nif11-like leader